MKTNCLDLLKFSIALATALVLSTGSPVGADTFIGATDSDGNPTGGDGVSWEDPNNWLLGTVPNGTSIFINGDHDVVFDSDSFDAMVAAGVTFSDTEYRPPRFLLNENTGAGAIGDNSITFDFGDTRRILTANSTEIFGGRPDTTTDPSTLATTTVNLISGNVNLGKITRFGVRENAAGVLNMSGGIFIIGREQLHIGVPGGGTGVANISGGTLRTRNGLEVNNGSQFNVLGSGVTEIGIGTHGTVDGYFILSATSTLSFGFDAGGVTPILVDEVDGIPGTSDDGVATFADGSTIDPYILDGFLGNDWVTVMTAEGGFVGSPTLSASSVDDGWELQIVGNDLQVRLPSNPGETPVETLKGDVDLNGTVNFSDIPAFIAVLQSGVFQAEADCDCDEAVTFSDISEFIAILQGS